MLVALALYAAAAAEAAAVVAVAVVEEHWAAEAAAVVEAAAAVVAPPVQVPAAAVHHQIAADAACLVHLAFPAFQACPDDGQPAVIVLLAGWPPCWNLSFSLTFEIAPYRQNQNPASQQHHQPVPVAEIQQQRHHLSFVLALAVADCCLTERDLGWHLDVSQQQLQEPCWTASCWVWLVQQLRCC